MTDDLRRRAEARLHDATETPPVQVGELQRLVHELRVHQIELELQNEELLQVQGRLREAETRYRLLSDLAAECIMWLGPQGEMRYVSPACEAMFGRKAAEFFGHSGMVESLVLPDDQPAYRAHTQVARQNEPGHIEFRTRSKDGGERWIEHHCEPMYAEDGSYLGQRCTNRDITQRKQDARELRQRNAELHTFNQAMVGRELAMVCLKKQVNALCRELGKEPPYPDGLPSAGVDIYRHF